MNKLIVFLGFALCAAAGAEEAGRQWRGVHVIAWGPAGGTEGLPALKRAINDVMVPLGVNVLVYEVGYNFAFEKRPDMRFGKLTTKEAARDLAEFCRARNIRLIPQFNCLGHQSWVKQNFIFPLMAWHPEMEEVPDLDYRDRTKRLKSWCPLHPGVNEIVFDLIDEIADAFQADAFHVGMDEVLTIGSPKCPRCAGKKPAELFTKAVNDLHGHLVKKRGKTMLMWGDRFLDASVPDMGKGWEVSDKGTAPAIDMVPKDIVICDWHYSLQKDYPSLRLFSEKGFRVWPSSWKDARAAAALIDCAQRQSAGRILGYLATSWVIEPGDFALALLGDTANPRLKDRALPAAEAMKAAMKKLQEDARR